MRESHLNVAIYVEYRNQLIPATLNWARSIMDWIGLRKKVHQSMYLLPSPVFSV